jgi:hypothetical protein
MHIHALVNFWVKFCLHVEVQVTSRNATWTPPVLKHILVTAHLLYSIRKYLHVASRSCT